MGNKIDELNISGPINLGNPLIKIIDVANLIKKSYL